jgi:hypothetical protein
LDLFLIPLLMYSRIWDENFGIRDENLGIRNRDENLGIRIRDENLGIRIRDKKSRILNTGVMVFKASRFHIVAEPMPPRAA